MPYAARQHEIQSRSNHVRMCCNCAWKAVRCVECENANMFVGYWHIAHAAAYPSRHLQTFLRCLPEAATHTRARHARHTHAYTIMCSESCLSTCLPIAHAQKRLTASFMTTYSHSRIKAYSHSRIKAYSHSRIKAYSHSRIKAYSHSRIKDYCCSTHNTSPTSTAVPATANSC
jgi:hypothetical protein